jgi:hypothetical protein
MQFEAANANVNTTPPFDFSYGLAYLIKKAAGHFFVEVPRRIRKGQLPKK